MSTILLTGGTGFIGRNLRAALSDRSVVLLGRREPTLLGNERWLHMDMAKAVAPEQLDGGEILCHLAYSMPDGHRNVLHNERLLEAVNNQPGIRRVVMTSSVAVYGANTSAMVDEESQCLPVGEYAESKLACEMVWREGLREDCKLTVLRPATVIGPGGEGLPSLIHSALHQPVVGAIKRSILHRHSVHYVSVNNVVAATCFCLRHPHASMRELYILSDDHQPENKSYATMQDAVRGILGKRPLPAPAMPRPVVRVLGAATNRPLLGLRQVYSSRKIHDAGFEDVMPLRHEVRRVVESVERGNEAP